MESTLDAGFKGWMVNGVQVVISATADIPSPFRPNQVRAGLVKQALSAVLPWHGSEGTVHTVKLLEKEFPLIVVPRAGVLPIWYKHIGHKAYNVQLSPFVSVRHPVLTSFLTVELTGTAGKPKLVRAYPGEYHPPLPWMDTAEHIDGGVERSVEFWREHAYILTDTNTVSKSCFGRRAPSWFTG